MERLKARPAGFITVAGAGATWINNLALDGSVTVATIVPPPKLIYSRAGTSVQFSWSDSLDSFKLQSQTDNLSVGLSSNWVDYPGGGTSPVTVPIDASKGAAFFRLISAP